MDRLLFYHGLENGVKSVMVKRIGETYQRKLWKKVNFHTSLYVIARTFSLLEKYDVYEFIKHLKAVCHCAFEE